MLPFLSVPSFFVLFRGEPPSISRYSLSRIRGLFVDICHGGRGICSENETRFCQNSDNGDDDIDDNNDDDIVAKYNDDNDDNDEDDENMIMMIMMRMMNMMKM